MTVINIFRVIHSFICVKWCKCVRTVCESHENRAKKIHSHRHKSPLETDFSNDIGMPNGILKNGSISVYWPVYLCEISFDIIGIVGVGPSLSVIPLFKRYISINVAL